MASIIRSILSNIFYCGNSCKRRKKESSKDDPLVVVVERVARPVLAAPEALPPPPPPLAAEREAEVKREADSSPVGRDDFIVQIKEIEQMHVAQRIVDNLDRTLPGIFARGLPLFISVYKVILQEVANPKKRWAIFLAMEEIYTNKTTTKAREILCKLDDNPIVHLLLDLFKEENKCLIDSFFFPTQLKGYSLENSRGNREMYFVVLMVMFEKMVENIKDLEFVPSKELNTIISNFRKQLSKQNQRRFDAFILPLKKEFLELEQEIIENSKALKIICSNFNKNRKDFLNYKGDSLFYKSAYNRIANFVKRIQLKLEMKELRRKAKWIEDFSSIISFLRESPKWAQARKRGFEVALEVLLSGDVQRQVVSEQFSYQQTCFFPVPSPVCEALAMTIPPQVYLQCVKRCLPVLEAFVVPDPEPRPRVKSGAGSEAEVKSLSAAVAAAAQAAAPAAAKEEDPSSPPSTPVAAPPPAVQPPSPAEQMRKVFEAASTKLNFQARGKLADAREHLESLLILSEQIKMLQQGDGAMQAALVFTKIKGLIRECNLAVEAFLMTIELNRDPHSKGAERAHDLSGLLELNDKVVGRLDGAAYDTIMQINRAEIKARRMDRLHAETDVEKVLERAHGYKGDQGELKFLKEEAERLTGKIYSLCNDLASLVHCQSRNFQFPPLPAALPQANRPQLALSQTGLIKRLEKIEGTLQAEVKANPALGARLENILFNHMRTLKASALLLEGATREIRIVLADIHLSLQFITEETLRAMTATRFPEKMEEWDRGGHNLIELVKQLGIDQGKFTKSELDFLQASQSRMHATRFTEGDRHVAVEADVKLNGDMHASKHLGHSVVDTTLQAGFSFQKGSAEASAVDRKKHAYTSIEALITILGKVLGIDQKVAAGKK